MSRSRTSAPSGMVVWLALLRTHQAMDRVARQSMDDVGLGFSDFVLLESLLHAGPLTPSQLGERVGLTRGSITAAVDRLGARGLVKRAPNGTDARSSLITLTKAGKTVITRAWAEHAKDIERVMRAALTTEEAAVMFKLLGPIRRVARREIERGRIKR